MSRKAADAFEEFLLAPGGVSVALDAAQLDEDAFSRKDDDGTPHDTAVRAKQLERCE